MDYIKLLKQINIILCTIGLIAISLTTIILYNTHGAIPIDVFGGIELATIGGLTYNHYISNLNKKIDNKT